MAKQGRPKSEGIPYPVKPYLTIEQSDWLDCQPNKSQAIANLIQQQIDMRPMTLVSYKINDQKTITAESVYDLIPQLKIPVGVETVTVVDRAISAPVPKYAAPCSIGSDGIHFRDGKAMEPTSWVQTIKFTVDRVSNCVFSDGSKSSTIHVFTIETLDRKDLINL